MNNCCNLPTLPVRNIRCDTSERENIIKKITISNHDYEGNLSTFFELVKGDTGLSISLSPIYNELIGIFNYECEISSTNYKTLRFKIKVD